MATYLEQFFTPQKQFHTPAPAYATLEPFPAFSSPDQAFLSPSPRASGREEGSVALLLPVSPVVVEQMAISVEGSTAQPAPQSAPARVDVVTATAPAQPSGYQQHLEVVW
jgi:hypothetical protein